MSKSIVVFGAGPALGRALAQRYAREGYAVVAVARRAEQVEELAGQLRAAGSTAHAIAADLADIDALPQLAKQIRSLVGDPDVLYYGVAADGFVSVTDLTPQRVEDLMPLGIYAPVALVQEFLPAMIARGEGTILNAQGASALYGMPHISGGLALAAQRNYLQALNAAVADKGIYVGSLYIGAAIERSPFHAKLLADRAAGIAVPDMPVVHPDQLADLLWAMHESKDKPEATYPDGLLDR